MILKRLLTKNWFEKVVTCCSVNMSFSKTWRLFKQSCICDAKIEAPELIGFGFK